MINMDYIPSDFTLDDMLAAFSEEAEVEYDNARIDKLSKTQIAYLRIRAEATKARQALAQLLLKDIQVEAGKGEGAAITRSEDSTSKPRYSLESIVWWAAFKYGIDISRWLSKPTAPSKDKRKRTDATWSEIVIKIKKGHQIAYSHKKGRWTVFNFEEIGLLDRRSRSGNYLSVILLGFSASPPKKFPQSKAAKAKDKTAISKLRTVLKKLTGIDSDPFFGFNEADGWKPKFKLIDDRRAADRRAEKAARHEEYNDELHYDHENDAASKFIENNE